MVSTRVLIYGNKVQNVDYRLFLLEKALENGIERIYVKNLGKDKVELLLNDKDDTVNNFYEAIKKERPKDATVREVKREPYLGNIPIPSIDRYFQFLTLEQLSRGREEVNRLPESMGQAVEVFTSTIGDIDEKFDAMMKKFGIFGQSAKRMDSKLSGIDGQLKGINEKMSKITTLPEKIDSLPERIAEALNSTKKK